MRPSSKLFLTILTAASALLMLAACNDRSPEKAEGAAAPAAASPAVTPTSPSSDTPVSYTHLTLPTILLV